jgi:hypothetical protein
MPLNEADLVAFYLDFPLHFPPPGCKNHPHLSGSCSPVSGRKRDIQRYMKSGKKQTPSWSDVKTAIASLDQSDLLDLISDMYHLSKDNKDFLHTRFSIGDDLLTPYKKIIHECMHPDILNEPIRMLRAKRAISDYSKAIRNAKGEAELLTYFVECGHKFTLYYGDIDEDFYDSLVEVYAQAIKKVLTLPVREQDDYRKRLKKIMISADGIGWGYHDGLCDEYYEVFQDDK